MDDRPLAHVVRLVCDLMQEAVARIAHRATPRAPRSERKTAHFQQGNGRLACGLASAMGAFAPLEVELFNISSPFLERVVADGVFHKAGFVLGDVGRNAKLLVQEL